MTMKTFAAIVSAMLMMTTMPARSAASDDPAIWKEFSALVRKGDFPRDRLKPLVPGGDADLLRFLAVFQSVPPSMWERDPEIVRSGSTVNFIIPFGDESRPFNFILVEEGDRWYFHHLEQVMLRLDKTPPAPTSDFPDTSEERKAWARDEIYWSQVVRLYTSLVPKLGKEAFLDLLRDGPGFFVAATAWVPFFAPHRAFVLYLCWYQARLHGMNTRGDSVVLESLDDRGAVVRMKDDVFFRLYQVATHIRPQIAFADYREIYEVIWKDRAEAAGWTLAIEYPSADGLEVLFRFSRNGEEPFDEARGL